MRIAMIGTGYVGLVSGACLSDFGHDVVCIDKDASKIDGAQERYHADLGAGTRIPGEGEFRSRSPQLHDQPVRGCRRRGSRVHRRRDANAPGRRSRRSHLRVRGRSRARPRARRTRPSSSPNRPSPLAQATASPSCLSRRALRQERASPPIRNSSAKALQSATSRFPTASSSAQRTTRHAKSFAKSTGPCSSIRRRCCSPDAAQPSSSNMRRTPSWR